MDPFSTDGRYGHVEEKAMKEMELLLKTVSDGLRILAQGVRVIADRIETFAEQSGEGSDRSPATSVPVREASEAPPLRKEPQKAAGRPVSGEKGVVSAPDRVHEALTRAGGPVNIDALAEETGLNKRQIHNAIYRLKKQGKVVNVSKAVYRAAPRQSDS